MYKSMIPLAVLILLLSAGCGTVTYKKLDSGLEYNIIGAKSGQQLKNGDFVKMTITQYYNDSLLSTPFDTIPQVVMVDSMRIPPEYAKIFFQTKVGDSVMTRISTDTLIARGSMLPTFAKPHQYMATRFKIWEVYENQEAAEKAHNELQTRMMRADSIAFEKQKDVDDATIKSYLEKNKINAVRSPEGTYIEVTNPGTGAQVDSGKAVSVLYKGMLLDGKIFDQSYDSTGAAKDPFTFVVRQPGAIEGWSDGMVYFKEGGVGRLFIPSARAYGSRGAGADIAPNTPIMFEVNITKVQDQEEYKKEMAERQKKLQEEMAQKQKEQEEKK